MWTVHGRRITQQSGYGKPTVSSTRMGWVYEKTEGIGVKPKAFPIDDGEGAGARKREVRNE